MDDPLDLYQSFDGFRWVDLPPLRLSVNITSETELIGYGRVQRNLMPWLEAAGGIELLEPTQTGWDFLLFFGYPRAWWLKGGGDDVIAHTMYEKPELPNGWVNILNQIRLIWVPSNWCKETFINNGVKAPIMVCGYGVNHNEFPYVERDWSAPFTFGAIAHSMFDRKGATQVLRCFAKLKMQGELKDARLIVKTQFGYLSDAWECPDGKQAKVYGPDGMTIDGIYYYFGSLKQDEYVNLLAHIHLLVYPHRGEGFGLIPLEFMATGGAVMLNDYSGCKEYIDRRLMIVLPEEPSDEDIMDKMVWAYHNQDEVQRLAREGAAYVRKVWTWQAVGLRARSLLYQHLRR